MNLSIILDLIESDRQGAKNRKTHCCGKVYAAAKFGGETMSIKEDLLRTLRALKPEIQARYKVKEIGLFGSFVRGEQSETSDIDILVDFAEGADLFDLVGLSLFLEGRLQRKVDVVSKSAVREELRERVFKEVATL